MKIRLLFLIDRNKASRARQARIRGINTYTGSFSHSGKPHSALVLHPALPDNTTCIARFGTGGTTHGVTRTRWRGSRVAACVKSQSPACGSLDLDASSVIFLAESKSRPGIPGHLLEGHPLGSYASSPPLCFVVHGIPRVPVEAFVCFACYSFVSACCWDLMIRVCQLNT